MGPLRSGVSKKESSWSKFVQVAVRLPLGHWILGLQGMSPGRCRSTIYIYLYSDEKNKYLDYVSIYSKSKNNYTWFKLNVLYKTINAWRGFKIRGPNAHTLVKIGNIIIQNVENLFSVNIYIYIYIYILMYDIAWLKILWGKWLRKIKIQI